MVKISEDRKTILLADDEADIREVGRGDAVDVIADAQGSKAFTTRISWLSSQAINKDDWSDSGYFQVLAKPSACGKIVAPLATWPCTASPIKRIGTPRRVSSIAACCSLESF